MFPCSCLPFHIHNHPEVNAIYISTSLAFVPYRIERKSIKPITQPPPNMSTFRGDNSDTMGGSAQYPPVRQRSPFNRANTNPYQSSSQAEGSRANEIPPPSYSLWVDPELADAFQLEDMSPAVSPRIPPPIFTGAWPLYEVPLSPIRDRPMQPQPTGNNPSSDEAFNFNFFKPRAQSRWKYLFLILLFITICAAAIAFPVTVFKYQHSALQNTTSSCTTMQTTKSFATTHTHISTKATTVHKTSTITHTTSVSSSPSSDAVACSDLLQAVCSHKNPSPLPDLSRGKYQGCRPIFKLFYCKFMDDVAALGISPLEDALSCAGMRDFCN